MHIIFIVFKKKGFLISGVGIPGKPDPIMIHSTCCRYLNILLYLYTYKYINILNILKSEITKEPEKALIHL